MYIYQFCVFCPVYEAHLDKQQNQQKREKGVIQREREREIERERDRERGRVSEREVKREGE